MLTEGVLQVLVAQKCRICDTCAADVVPKAAFATPVQRICDTCAADLVPKAVFATPVQQFELELQPPSDAKIAKFPRPAAQTLNRYILVRARAHSMRIPTPQEARAAE